MAGGDPETPMFSLILDGLPTFAHYFSTKEILNYLPRKVENVEDPSKTQGFGFWSPEFGPWYTNLLKSFCTAEIPTFIFYSYHPSFAQAQ